ncbi:hypothetical protein V1478_014386, partial [Vespula squamosa]
QRRENKKKRKEEEEEEEEEVEVEEVEVEEEKKKKKKKKKTTKRGNLECRHLAARADHTRRRVKNLLVIFPEIFEQEDAFNFDVSSCQGRHSFDISVTGNQIISTLGTLTTANNAITAIGFIRVSLKLQKKQERRIPLWIDAKESKTSLALNGPRRRFNDLESCSLKRCPCRIPN